MALSDDIVEILASFGQETKENLQQSLRDKGVKFGGQDSKLSNKIKFEVSQKGSAISFILSMPDYYEYVDKGRMAAGVSQEGQQNIANWIKRKGLITKFSNDDLQARLARQAKNNTGRKRKALVKKPFEKSLKALTYLIGRKLKSKGFNGNGFYTEVIKDGRVEDLKESLAKILKKDVEIQIRGLKE